jgi:putative ABC transport system substrate-binding protein
MLGPELEEVAGMIALCPDRRVVYAVASEHILGARFLVPKPATCQIPTIGEKSELHATESAAQMLRINLIYVAFTQSPFGASPELDKALETVRRAQPDAMVVFPEGATMANRATLANFAIAHRLPSMFGWSEYAEAGGLMSYGASQRDAHAQLASYADKILKGAKPGDLPIEQPTKFELVFNLKTAKALGLTIPPSLLLQADKVIE